MQQNSKTSFLILGIFIFLGLSTLGYFFKSAIIEYKQYDRSVKVKGLSEKEYKADIVIWPITYTEVSNNLEELYNSIDKNNEKINSFLISSGIEKSEITFSTPIIIDKVAQQYGNEKINYRYNAKQTITVYSKNIDAIRAVKSSLSKLGKQGIVFSGDNYGSSTEYIFTRLNEVKPKMIEEATKKAREVAQKFAFDSKSKLGKIKSASQGQFTISQRDKNNPQIKKVRVVSTVEYYLTD
ncbi:SIMPL domain-containing protein [Arcobacter sp.]|uniref:SIMPL domain-containing protein n=1 Tax=Arcobacter sp. TaxID=1872629 RepID=UPI003C723E9F